MIKNNEIWCSSIPQLNDPTEASYSIEEFEKRLILGLNGLLIRKLKQFKQENVDNYKSSIQKLLNLYVRNFGIYSLSKNYNNALMWSHYGNGHQGFCIEYDFETLKELNLKFSEYNPMEHLYRFSKVNYSNKIYNLKKLNLEYDDLIQFLFYKSEIWSYEEEYRIITNCSGKFKYNPDCLKSITFGLNIGNTEKNIILEMLSSKHIDFFQIKRKVNEFKFLREKI